MSSYVTDSTSLALDREAKRLVSHYDFTDAATVTFLSQSENKIFLLSDPNRSGKYVVRINSGRVSYHTPASIASELMWLTALRRDTDIIVPDVLGAKDGSLVQTIDAPDLGYPRHAVVYSFLSGKEPSTDDLVPGFERLGEISARMHCHARSWTPPAEFVRHSWTPEVILDDHLNWGPWQAGVGLDAERVKLITRLDLAIRKRLASLSMDRERFGLIHADLRLTNLLVEDERTAIIDFDDCGYGWYLFDLAAALSFLEERAEVPELIASWLKGYARVAQPPADVEAEIPTLIMLRRLQLLGWVAYQQQHLDFARQIGHRFTSDTCRLADEYLTNFA